MLHMDNLKKLPTLAKGNQAGMDGFTGYTEAAFAQGAIPKKYKELIAIAVGLTTQCAYCIEVHKKAARAEGATDEEMAEAVHIAGALRAGGAVTYGTHLFD